jgi:hypothetical protein
MIAVALLALAPTLAFDVQGSVSDLSLLPDGSIRALVTNPQKPTKGYDKAIVRIGKTTPVVDLKGADARAFLRDGTLVGVTFTGPVLESYPVQAAAKRVVILKEKFYATGKLVHLARTPHGLRFTVLDAQNQPYAVATVMPKTKIFKVRNGKRVPAPASELRNGVRVSMDYDGPVAMSMPPQGGAGIIVIH